MYAHATFINHSQANCLTLTVVLSSVKIVTRPPFSSRRPVVPYCRRLNSWQWWWWAKASAGFWLGGVSASLPPEAKKIGKFCYKMVLSKVYVVSIAPFSTPAFTPHHSENWSFCMFSLFNFSSVFFRGVSWPHCPQCADARGVGTWLIDWLIDWLVHWVDVLNPTQYEMGRFEDGSFSPSFGMVLE